MPKKAAKDFPNTNSLQWRGVEKEIESQTDRGAAILAGTMVQDAVVAAILDRLPTKGTEIEMLFQGEGQISTFALQSKLAFGLGIISQPVLNDLNCIRTIRNAFAHIAVEKGQNGLAKRIGFSTGKIADLCKNLTIVDKWRHLKVDGCIFTLAAKSPDLVEKIKDPRQRFITSCIKLAAAITPRFDSSNEPLDY